MEHGTAATPGQVSSRTLEPDIAASSLAPVTVACGLAEEPPTREPCTPGVKSQAGETRGPARVRPAGEPCTSGANPCQDRVQQFLQAVVTPMNNSAPAMPTLQPPRSRRTATPTTNPIRRSRRIANNGCRGNALDKAQYVLMRKLGILGEQEQLSQDARDAYARLFEHPLSRPHLAAVASIFGWTVPENYEAREADLLLS